MKSVIAIVIVQQSLEVSLKERPRFTGIRDVLSLETKPASCQFHKVSVRNSKGCQGFFLVYIYSGQYFVGDLFPLYHPALLILLWGNFHRAQFHVYVRDPTALLFVIYTLILSLHLASQALLRLHQCSAWDDKRQFWFSSEFNGNYGCKQILRCESHIFMLMFLHYILQYILHSNRYCFSHISILLLQLTA